MEFETLAKYLDYGLLGLTIVMLLLALVWAVKQWLGAESRVDAEKDARLEDTKIQAALGVEFKNATLVAADALKANTSELAALRVEVASSRQRSDR